MAPWHIIRAMPGYLPDAFIGPFETFEEGLEALKDEQVNDEGAAWDGAEYDDSGDAVQDTIPPLPSPVSWAVDKTYASYDCDPQTVELVPCGCDTDDDGTPLCGTY